MTKKKTLGRCIGDAEMEGLRPEKEEKEKVRQRAEEKAGGRGERERGREFERPLSRPHLSRSANIPAISPSSFFFFF
jgi:hypothetical protein